MGQALPALIPSFPKTATELAASGFPLPPRDAGIAVREVDWGAVPGGCLNRRETRVLLNGKMSGAWLGGPRLLLSGRVRCISKKLQSSPPSITPTPAFFQAAMGDASEPNIQASCTQDPDASSTSPNNQTSSGLPIPAGDQTCPVFLAGTLLLGTAQPQLRASDLRSS